MGMEGRPNESTSPEGRFGGRRPAPTLREWSQVLGDCQEHDQEWTEDTSEAEEERQRSFG